MPNDRTFLFAPEDENEAQALLEALERGGVSATLGREGMVRFAVHVAPEDLEGAERILASWAGHEPPSTPRRRITAAPLVMAALLGVSLAANLYLLRRVQDRDAPPLTEYWPGGEVRTSYTLSEGGEWVTRWVTFDRRGRPTHEGFDRDGDGVSERIVQRAGRLDWEHFDDDADGSPERYVYRDARGGRSEGRDRDGDGHFEELRVSSGGRSIYETRDADADGIYERMVFHGGARRVVLTDSDFDGFLERVRCESEDGEPRVIDLAACELRGARP